MEALLLALSPFVLNGVMTFIKWLAQSDTFSTSAKRFILAILSILGSVALNHLTGAPINLDSLSELSVIALTALVQFLTAHGSYTLFFKKKTE